MSIRRALVLAVVALVSAPAWSASPSLGNFSPAGGQRGTEVETLINGARLSDIKEILFHRPGIEVVKLEVVSDNQAKAKLKIAADAPLGEYPARIRTATGLTELKTFYVGPYAGISEKELNSDFKTPQKINLGVTVHGVVEYEDVDYFAVEAKKGERISAEVEAIRLGQVLFDPFVAILDAKRFELSGADDTALALQDGFASIVAPADGTYVIQVRESSYGGNGAFAYRLHVGRFPRPTAVYPAGGKIGQDLEFKYLGDVSGDIAAKLKLPDGVNESFPLFCSHAGEVSPSPNRIRVSEFPNVLEAEPNDAIVKDAEPVGAPLPLALNGIIEKDGDVDCFRVTMKQGETFDIHCYARRLRSALDPVVTVHNVDGGAIAGNDDAIGPDSYLRFAAPAAGDYFIRVTDHLNKGGKDYVYRIEIAPPKATLTLSLPQVAQSSQERQTVPVPRGNRYAALVAANRVNFGGELVIGAENLPAGVKIASENMQANLGLVPVVFEAAPDAPVGGKLVDLIGKHADPKAGIVGHLEQKIDLVTGPPNITVYYQIAVDRLSVAVTDEAPFKISIVEPKAPLVQDGSMELKIVAERKPDYKAPIAVYMPFLPPGVGAAAGVTIPEGQNTVSYPINANGGAQARTWKIVAIAQATVGNGPVWVSSQLANLTITPPYVGLQIQMAAAEQGKPTEVVAKVQVNTPFEGQATAKLLGLPAKVAAKDLTVTKETKEIVFPVTIDPTSPAGQHKTLFCQLTVTEKGEPVIHNLNYGATLRIDPPPPMPAAAPVAAAAPAQAAAPAAAKPPEKRLTRLEQLRLEHAERAKAQAAKAARK